jgi:hypothetical protein
MATRRRNDELTATEIANARKHRGKGLSYASIGRMIGRSGGAVFKVLKSTETTKPAPSKRSSKSSHPTSVHAPTTNAHENKPSDPLARLAACLAFLDQATSFCASAEDWNRVSMIQKIVKDVVKTIADLTPAPPPNLDEAPAITRAAAEFERKFFERAERILTEATS